MAHSQDNRNNYRQDDGHAFGFVRHDQDSDQRGAGRGEGFRGVGPKGYSRPDERIMQDVCDRLYDDDRIDASGISVSIAAGEVTLDGVVPSRQTKRAAEDCAEGCAGVSHVQNNLRVQRGGDTPST